MREIVIDTETTGLDVKNGHRLIEIGGVELVNKMKTGRVYHTYLNPGRDVPYEAFAVHGIASEFLLDKPLFGDVIEDFLDFIDGATLVIHNAAFDVKFLNHELQLITHSHYIELQQVVDTLSIARRKFPGSPASLDALCRRFNISLSGRIKHGALVDAELLAEVYLELCGGIQASLATNDTGFIKDSVKEYNLVKTKRNSLTRPKRTFSISEEDLVAHKEFVAAFEASIWHKLYNTEEEPIEG